MPLAPSFEDGAFNESWHRMMEGFKNLEHRVLAAPGRKRWMDHAWLADFQVRSCGSYVRAQGHRWRRQGIDEGVLIYCTQGQGWYRCRQQTWHLSAGDLLWCPPATVHAYGSDEQDPWTILWCHLAGSAVGQHVKLAGISDADPVMHCGLHSDMIRHFNEIIDLFTPTPDERCMLALQAAARHLFGSAVSIHRPGVLSMAATRAVSRAQAHLSTNLHRRFDLKTLARLAGVSPWHLSRIFRTATGQPPQRWFLRARIEQAGRLLAGAASIADVAQHVGFTDPMHFSRCFHRITGVSPSQWRKVHR